MFKSQFFRVLIVICFIVIAQSVFAAEPTCNLTRTSGGAVISITKDSPFFGTLCDGDLNSFVAVKSTGGLHTIKFDSDEVLELTNLNEKSQLLVFRGYMPNLSKSVEQTPEDKKKIVKSKDILLCSAESNAPKVFELIALAMPAIITGIFAILASLGMALFSQVTQTRKQSRAAVTIYQQKYLRMMETYLQDGGSPPEPPNVPDVDSHALQIIIPLRDAIREVLGKERVPSELNERQALVNKLQLAIKLKK